MATHHGSKTFVPYCGTVISLYDLALAYEREPREIATRYRSLKQKAEPTWQQILNREPHGELIVVGDEVLILAEAAKRLGITYTALRQRRWAKKTGAFKGEVLSYGKIEYNRKGVAIEGERGNAEWEALGDKNRKMPSEITQLTSIERRLWNHHLAKD